MPTAREGGGHRCVRKDTASNADTYTHLSPEMKRAAAHRMAAALRDFGEFMG